MHVSVLTFEQLFRQVFQSKKIYQKYMLSSKGVFAQLLHRI